MHIFSQEQILGFDVQKTQVTQEQDQIHNYQIL